MRLLTAAAAPDGDDEWAYTVPGEIVFPAYPCDAQAYHPVDVCSCGCSVAFVGLASRSGTTCAVVAEVDVTRELLAALLVDFVAPAAEDAAFLLDPEVRDDAEQLADELIKAGASFPLGMLVRREQKEIISR